MITNIVTWHIIIDFILTFILAGLEKAPMSRSHNGQGRVVYEYEPVVGSFVSNLIALELPYYKANGCLLNCKHLAFQITIFLPFVFYVLWYQFNFVAGISVGFPI